MRMTFNAFLGTLVLCAAQLAGTTVAANSDTGCVSGAGHLVSGTSRDDPARSTCAEGSTVSSSEEDHYEGSHGERGPRGRRGPRGPRGAQGSIGKTGPRGAEGIEGLRGPAGVQGSRGAQGPRGLRGLAGANGSPGEPGVLGIYRVEGDLVTPSEMDFFTAAAFCEPGDVAVGGGFRAIEFAEFAPSILSSASFSGTDWTVEGQGGEGQTGSLVAQVICADLTS